MDGGAVVMAAQNEMPSYGAVRTARLWKTNHDTLYIAQLLKIHEAMAQRYLAEAKRFGLVK